MRKILTSVLSVAGLLAVVLALASSPASAAKQVVKIETPANDAAGNAGTYTISWKTQGGCDPGSGTSGASGSVTMTIAEGTAGSGMGDQVETGVVIDNICNYTWEAGLMNTAGADCRIDDFATPGAGTMITLVLTTDGCATTGKVNVTVSGPVTGEGITAAVLCLQTDIDGAEDGDPCKDGDLMTEKVPAMPNERNGGAVKNTTFTVTATPQKGAKGVVPEGCNAASKETELNYDTNKQYAQLTLVDRSLGGKNCKYTVTAVLPAGFAAGDGSARNMANLEKDVNPDSAAEGPDGVDGDDADGINDAGQINLKADLMVSVASVKVYLVQNVIGDAGGASATYKLDTPCGAPGLPAALTARSDSGGITRTSATNVVELRTGRFNVTAALAEDPTDSDAANGVIRHALAPDGNACEATVSVSGVPAGCSTDGASASLASASDTVILEVTVDCSVPVAPEPPAAEAMDGGADDMGDGDDGADDMGDGDDGMGDMGDGDDGMDDMGDGDGDGDDVMDDMGDGADVMGDGADVMGPPEDVATG